MAVGDWSNTAASNTTVGGISIGPNCDLGNIDNSLREIMKQVKDWYDTVSAALGGSDVQPLDASLTAYAALTTAADKGLYFTGADAPAIYSLTSFGRTLAGSANAAAALASLGAFGIDSSSLGSTGYIKFTNGLMFQWGSVSASANGTTTISYSQSYTTWSRCWCNGVHQATGAQDNNPQVIGGSGGLSSATIYSSEDLSLTCDWFAIGV